MVAGGVCGGGGEGMCGGRGGMHGGRGGMCGDGEGWACMVAGMGMHGGKGEVRGDGGPAWWGCVWQGGGVRGIR